MELRSGKKPTIAGSIRSTASSVANMIRGKKEEQDSTLKLNEPNYASTQILNEQEITEKEIAELREKRFKELQHIEKYYTERKEAARKNFTEEREKARKAEAEYKEMQEKIERLKIEQEREDEIHSVEQEYENRRQQTNKSLESLNPAYITREEFLSTQLGKTEIKFNDKRVKVLESLVKTPIPQWSRGDNNLYIFLKTEVESYLKVKSYTKAETVLAISDIFKESLWAETKAAEIAESNLPDEIDTNGFREQTYKALALELDAGGTTTIEPLKTNERIIDLFFRIKLAIECEEIGNDKEVEETINYRSMIKMMSSRDQLMPEEKRFELKQIWLSRIITESDDRKIKTNTVISILTQFDRASALFDKKNQKENIFFARKNKQDENKTTEKSHHGEFSNDCTWYNGEN